jgi:hypothetical protein
MFGHLREAEANKVDAPRPVDLTPECCTMMEKLMLAQAQVGSSPPRGPCALAAAREQLRRARRGAPNTARGNAQAPSVSGCSAQMMCTSCHRIFVTLHPRCPPQECVYHKAVVDRKSPGVVARLAKQAATMYGEVTALFNAPVRRAAGCAVPALHGGFRFGSASAGPCRGHMDLRAC